MVKIASCSKCDCGKKRIIVNKHFSLCQEKNEERLNATNGRLTKQAKAIQVRQRGIGDKTWSVRNNTLDISMERRKPIRKTSISNKYRTSAGELVSQREINKRYKAVCAEIDQERDQICEGLGIYLPPLSHSHTISRKRCKELGKAELIYAKDNIFLESMGSSDSAHLIWENAPLLEKKKLLNFEKKLAYIKIHDPETYRKMTL